MDSDRATSIIKVLIADDHPVVLEGLAMIMKKIDKVRVIGMIKNGSEVLERVKQLSPDILLLDVVMPDFDAMACIKQINETDIPPRIICCSSLTTKAEIMPLVYAGIAGYVSKSAMTDEIKDAVVKVGHGGKYFSADISDMIISTAISKHNHYKEVTGDNLFSEKEIEIIQLICENKTVKEISVHIDVNARTLEAAKNRIMKKMGVKNVVGIVSYAIKNRIIDINTLQE